MATVTGNPEIYSSELEEALNDEFARIGCYDYGNGGLIAMNKNGFMAVADSDVWLVVEGVLDRLKECPDDFLKDRTYEDMEWNTFWHDILGQVE